MRILLFFLATAVSATAQLRPPATPLVVHDPYFSIWSTSDHPADSTPSHWSGQSQEIASMVRIDGETYRLLSVDPRWRPTGEDTEAFPMTSLEVTPTRSIYRFAGHGIEIALQFLTPILPNDLDLLSSPATHITWTVSSADGQPHEVQLYFHATAEIVRELSQQRVNWSRFVLDGHPVLRLGTEDQEILGKRGDRLRIDWGYLYAAPAAGDRASTAVTDRLDAWQEFRGQGALPASDDLEPDLNPGRPRMPVLAIAFDLGRIADSAQTRRVVVAYDDLFSVEFFHERQRPYWRRNKQGVAQMLREALAGFSEIERRAKAFDEELIADLTAVGGKHYAEICALAYRQTFGAHKLTIGRDGEPYMYSKENHSNGSIATVDVTYPGSPVYLLLNPDLLKAQLRPIFEYARMERWPFPFAPHDAGQYPLANGQAYGGGEESEDRQMPVEESANMILMTAGIVFAEDDPAFAQSYWPLLSQWAEYLQDKGFDPESQLSTDDFTGHLAHNTNLSLKAILALGAYAQLCQRLGLDGAYRRYRGVAESFAARWVEEADDGDHFRLAFDKPGTWSQKYNLIWDRILNLGLFPPRVARKELEHYIKVQNEYGVPLDNRSRFTKLDWIYWSATLSGDPEHFRALTEPAYKFANETPDRVPLTDWYWTHDARRRGFQARSVVGGLFARMITDAEVWRKWAGRAK